MVGLLFTILGTSSNNPYILIKYQTDAPTKDCMMMIYLIFCKVLEVNLTLY